MTSTQTIIEQLPGKDCGLCGLTSCQKFAEIVTANPASIDRCLHVATTKSVKKMVSEEFVDANITWKDHLNRDFDFVLDKFPGESGPRETMLPFNPANVEKLGIKKGDIIYGRPGWISCGCPVTHVGMVVEDPDYFNGTIVWCIVGPMLARERGINIGYYNTTAYEGIVKTSRATLEIGRRYYFQPRYCMLQWRHCGLVNSIGKTPDGLRVRIEGLWIG
jgi:uncharacterized Fe-S cluster-containing protein